MIEGTSHPNEPRHESRAGATYTEFLKTLRQLSELGETDAILAAASVLTRVEQILHAPNNDLEAQLPSKLRELLTMIRADTELPNAEHGADFDALVAKDMRVDEARARELADAVFTTVRGFLSTGELESVAARLPAALRPRWAPYTPPPIPAP